ncbi:ATP-dependent DNA helicase RecG [Patescibacteria group bacterium]|nr:ATP-dependent DNA helicase RecG [Patescibacteria group bacterium]
MRLNSILTNELRLTEYQKGALKKLDLNTIKDLLWYFPARYEQAGELKTIADAQPGEKVSLSGKISNLKLEKTWRKKMNIARATLNDGTGIIKLVWFHQPFIANILKERETITVSGKIQSGKNGPYLANPQLLKLNFDSWDGLMPVYPETRGLSSRWFNFTIKKILKKILDENKNLPDLIPEKILQTYKLPSLKNALVYIHTPKETKNAEAARKRFAFEEIFLVQISRIKKRLALEKQASFPVKIKKDELNNFTKNFSFKLTEAQKRAVEYILADMQKGSPMARLMEGDVGSGKTAVAAIASFLILKNGYQVAYMAPTEILAKQLFESFCDYFAKSGAKIGLLTSSICRKFPSKISYQETADISKAKLLKWISEGEIDIIIGTHSLIQDRVKFSAKDKIIYQEKKLALVIIDEQHRFGINQRAALINKKNETDQNIFPHFLSMTATPIPRTLALTIYGDLDLVLLDEMPPGRKKIITEIVPPDKRETAYEKIREEIKKGRQAYVVCPRIAASETLELRNVEEEYEKLSKKIFPEYKIEMLHGKMPAKDKEEIMQKFKNGEIDILISTSVIEVGVDVPNATTIIIEGADRFGLAQLHQMRGRVLRSIHQPHCFIFTESKTKKTAERLKALGQAKNGFELAEYDLQFRGPGELSGKKQWGISDVGMEALKNIKMVEAARQEARNILQENSELKNYPLLKEKIEQENSDIHME